jgi:hypothetical protein
MNFEQSISSNIKKDDLHNRIERLERIVLNNVLEENKNKNIQEIKETRSRNKDYKTPIKEILSATSLQFLLSPIRTKRILIRIINTSFLVISLCLSIRLVVSNINDFLMYETTTSIAVINDWEPEFPIVSFCPVRNLTYENNFTSFWFNNENLTTEWKNYFEAFQDSSYTGKCYRFNSGINMTSHSVSIKKTKRSGYNDGFYLEYKSDANSLTVSIYNQTQKPSTIFNKGYYISAGTRNYFRIKRIYGTKLEDPYNDCLKDVSKFTMNKFIIDYMKRKNWQYSEKECVRLCENLKYLEECNCNCSLDNLDDFPYKVYYYNNEQLNCYLKFIDNFNKKNIFHICSEYCPLECDSFNYDILINSRTSGSLSNKDIYGIYVFYEDLKYTLISQQPKMQFIDLISNIGGSLGLFVGISFISFLELFEILIEIIFIRLEK